MKSAATLLCSQLLCLALIIAPAVTAGEPPRVTASTPLAEYARQAEGKEFYGLYMLGGKVGWMAEHRRMTTHKGTTVVEGSYEMLLGLWDSGSKKMALTAKGQRLYSLEGDGSVVYATETRVQDGDTTEHEAVREGSNLRITTTKSGKTSVRVVPLPRDTLKAQRDFEVWLGGARKKGETFKSVEMDLEDDDAVMEVSTEFVSPDRLVWGGIPVNASKVKMTAGGASFEALVGPGGQLMRGKLGGFLEFRSEEEAVAKARGNKSIDMVAASMIPVSQPLGDPVQIRALTLELSGLGDFSVPASARQRVRKTGAGRAVVELSREPGTPSAVPLAQNERKRLLESTPSVQSDDLEIRALSKRIIGTEKDPRKAAAALSVWVNRNLRATSNADASTATAVLKNKAGDCTEHTLLFTALARAAGIPTRQVGGIMYTGDDIAKFAWHAWAEIHDGRGWVGIDPTWSQVGVDATHILFTADFDNKDDADFSWLGILGAVRMKVVNVDRGT